MNLIRQYIIIIIIVLYYDDDISVSTILKCTISDEPYESYVIIIARAPRPPLQPIPNAVPGRVI